MTRKPADVTPPQALADDALRAVTGGSAAAGDQPPLWLGDTLEQGMAAAGHDAARFTAITDRLTQMMQDMNKDDLQDIG